MKFFLSQMEMSKGRPRGDPGPDQGSEAQMVSTRTPQEDRAGAGVAGFTHIWPFFFFLP